MRVSAANVSAVDSEAPEFKPSPDEHGKHGADEDLESDAPDGGLRLGGSALPSRSLVGDDNSFDESE